MAGLFDIIGWASKITGRTVPGPMPEYRRLDRPEGRMSVDWQSIIGQGFDIYGARRQQRMASQSGIPYYLERPGGTMADMGGGAVREAGGRSYRRMNPMNARAARRAVRRLKSVRKLLQSIERTMPKRTVKISPFRRRK